MKKILIPIIGLLVLILLTPIILAKLANSNIDKKITSYKEKGIYIKEIKKDISYLNSKRVFEVEFNQNSNVKNWNTYKQYINSLNFIVEVGFKNLPVTKAKLDINIKSLNIANKNYLNGLKLHIITKNFKTFNYTIDDYKKDLVLKGVKGIYEVKKYEHNKIFISELNFNTLKIKNSEIEFLIKNLKLNLVDMVLKVENLSYKYNDIDINCENIEENLTNHLLGMNNKYKLLNAFKANKLEVTYKNQKLALKTINSDLNFNDFKFNSLKDANIKFDFKWNNTIYKNILLDGGEIFLDGKILSKLPKTINDFNGNLKIDFTDNLFNYITKDLNPFIVNKYLKKELNIKIKNGEIEINGNRI